MASQPHSGAYQPSCSSNEDGFETHITNVRAAFHNLRLRAHRLLALLCLFDVLFSFITWALVSQVRYNRRLHRAHVSNRQSLTQGFHGDFKKNYIAESVLKYRFDNSLFDVIVSRHLDGLHVHSVVLEPTVLPLPIALLQLHHTSLLHPALLSTDVSRL